MKDYLKPSIRENNPDHIIFHVGTNDIPPEKTPQVIAQSIVDLATTVANDNLQVTVSSIVPRNDLWSKKVYEVNKILLNLCKDVNIPFISHSVIDAKRNLNNTSWDNVARNESESSDGLSTKSKESLSTATDESFVKVSQLSASNEDICFGQHLNNFCRINIGRLILAHININSIRYKFDQLVYGVKGKVDVLMIRD